MNEGGVDDQALYADVGRRIRDARLRQNLTQDALASAISLTRTSITNIEKGRQKILLHTLFDVAGVLGVEPTSLLPQPKQTNELEVETKMPAGLSQKTQKLIESAIATPTKGA